MKKIGYVINSLRKNGPTNVLLNMIKGINKNRYEVFVLTIVDENDKDIKEGLIKKNIRVIEFNYPKTFKTILRNKEICDFINKENIDIIHTHGHVPTYMLKKIDAIKISTVHCCLYEDFQDTYGKLKGFFINELYVFALKKFDGVICCSKSSYSIVKKRIKNCSYVRNGIDFSDINYIDKKIIRKKIRKELNIPLSSKVYIFVGVLNNGKNVLRMLEEFKDSLKNDEYLIVLGDGILKDEVKKYSSEYIKILGFKGNVKDYLNASDIYTSFSLSEGFSISIIEALSCNLLLLLSYIPSHKECFSIDNKYYLGEVFKNENFKIKKNIVSEFNGTISTSFFQKKYLSSKLMMKEYEKYYEFYKRGE